MCPADVEPCHILELVETLSDNIRSEFSYGTRKTPSAKLEASTVVQQQPEKSVSSGPAITCGERFWLRSASKDLFVQLLKDH
jgi:hypothetical protein